MPRTLAFLSALYLLPLATSTVAPAQRLDESWVWCEPRDTLAYFIQPAAAAWVQGVDNGAQAWSNNTPWNLKKVNAEGDARIVITEVPINTVMQALVNRNHHRGEFNITEYGTVVIGGLLKPCVLKAEIQFWRDPNNPPVNRQNTAMHEFGHAFGINDTRNRADIMFQTEQNLIRLSQADINSATAAFGRSNLNQLHRLFRPEGGVLAFNGVEMRVPGGLAEAAVLGILTLSPSSLPFPSVFPAAFDRVLAAAQVGPEWSEGEVEPGVPYRQKEVPLAEGFEIAITLPLADEGVLALAEFQDLNSDRPPLDEESLVIAQYAGEGYDVLDTAVAATDSALVLTARAPAFGYFAVFGREMPEQPAPPEGDGFLGSLWVWILAAVAALAVLALVLLKRRRRAS